MICQYFFAAYCSNQDALCWILPVVFREECSSSSNNSSDEDPKLVGSNPSYSSNSFWDSVAESPPSVNNGTIACRGVSSTSKMDGVPPLLQHHCRSSFQGNYEGEAIVDGRQWAEEQEDSRTSAERDWAQRTRLTSICGTGIIGGSISCDTDDPPPMVWCLSETVTSANRTEAQQGGSSENDLGDLKIPFPTVTATESVLGFNTETTANDRLRSTPSAIPATGSSPLRYSPPSLPQPQPPQHPPPLSCVSKEVAGVENVRESHNGATSTDFAALEINLERWGIPPAFPPRPPPSNLHTPVTLPTHRCHKYQPEELSQQRPVPRVEPRGINDVWRAISAEETSHGGASRSLESSNIPSPGPPVHAESQPPTVGTGGNDNLSSQVVVAAEKARSSRTVLFFNRTWLDGIKLQQQHHQNETTDSCGQGGRHEERRKDERNVGRGASGRSTPSVGTPFAEPRQGNCWGLGGGTAGGGPSDRGLKNLREEGIGDGDFGEEQKKNRRGGAEVVTPAYPRWQEEKTPLSLANAWKRMTEDVLRQTAEIGGESVFLATRFKRPWLPSQLDSFQKA